MTPSREMIFADIKKHVGTGYVYLASPYSKLVKTVGLQEAYRIVCLAAGSFIEERICVFSPISHGHSVAEAYGLDKLDQEMWMEQCYPLVERANVLVVLKFEGWRESAGVTAEVERFRKTVEFIHGPGKAPIFYVDPDDVIPAIKINSPA